MLAAAILVGALVIASSMRANRYYFANGSDRIILDARTGAVYMGPTRWDMITQPVE